MHTKNISDQIASKTRYSVGICAIAAACICLGSAAYAQDTVQTQPRTVDTNAPSKTTITMQDGTQLTCDLVNGAPTNCAPIQAAPAPAVQQPVYPKVTITNQDGSTMQCDNINGTMANCVVVQPAQQQQVVYTQPAQQPQVVYTQPQQQVVYTQPAQQPQVVYAQPAPKESGDTISINVSSGHFFFTFGVEYQFLLWDEMNGGGELTGVSNHFGHNVGGELTLGYHWKYLGLFTTLNITGGWATDDCDKVLRALYSIADSAETDFHDLMIGWFVGPIIRAQFGAVSPYIKIGIGLENIRTPYEIQYYETKYDYSTMSEIKVKTEKEKGTRFNETVFGFKLSVGSEFAVSQNFLMGLAFNYTMVDLGGSDTFKNVDPINVIGVSLNFTYKN